MSSESDPTHRSPSPGWGQGAASAQQLLNTGGARENGGEGVQSVIARLAQTRSGGRAELSSNDLFTAWAKRQRQALEMLDRVAQAGAEPPATLREQAERAVVEARMLREAALAKFRADLQARGIASPSDARA